MFNINNEQDFIKYIQSIKELNEKHAINLSKILDNKKTTGYDLSNIASEPNLKEEYAKDAIIIDATNKILSYVFNGLIATINSNEMTIEQNQFLNSTIANPQQYTLEEKQKQIKNGIHQHGIGKFYQAPLFNRYTFGNYYSLNNSLFDKVFKDDYWIVEQEIFLPELLGIQKDKVSETLISLKSGNFPIKLSSENKENLFNILYTHDKIYENAFIDKEINHKKR